MASPLISEHEQELPYLRSVTTKIGPRPRRRPQDFIRISEFPGVVVRERDKVVVGDLRPKAGDEIADGKNYGTGCLTKFGHPFT